MFDYKKYADLLVQYCLEIKPGDRFLLRSNANAEPLIKELYRACYQAGGNMETIISFEEQDRIFYENSQDVNLEWVSPLLDHAYRNFETTLFIRSPYNLSGAASTPETQKKLAKVKASKKELSKIYSERTAARELRRSLCVFPNNALAQKADMTLSEYEAFVTKALKLDQDDPVAAWEKLGKNQQKVTDFLNTKSKFRYKGNGTDITFHTEGRTWINSDGRTNCPSGEIYTSPIEDSVNGEIYFNLVSVHMGAEIKDIRLKVENGYVTDYDAGQGKEIMDNILSYEGARYFGEAAIGTNYDIQRITKNTLFDEKIGGTIHMALGQSYLQCGGKNSSAIHWDMITEMKDGGEIYADDEIIYKDGRFLEFDLEA